MFWRYKININLCNPKSREASLKMRKNNADVAQLARARDL